VQALLQALGTRRMAGTLGRLFAVLYRLAPPLQSGPALLEQPGPWPTEVHTP